MVSVTADIILIMSASVEHQIRRSVSQCRRAQHHDAAAAAAADDDDDDDDDAVNDATRTSEYRCRVCQCHTDRIIMSSCYAAILLPPASVSPSVCLSVRPS